MPEDILVENKTGVLWITLNRPEARNAIRLHITSAELVDAIAEARDDTSVRAVVLTGADPAFCAGGDVKEMAAVRAFAKGNPDPHDIRQVVRGFHRALAELYELEKPVIAAVNGPAVGAGFSLSLACDLRIASDQAYFAMAFVNRGLTSDAGSTYLLPRIVGYPKAYELLTTGDRVDADEALRLGLVTRVVLHADLHAETQTFAERLAAGPPNTLAIFKRSLRLGESTTLHDTLENEANMQSLCMLGGEHAEGIAAFIEKRPPAF
jgi:enoyl-CoA hydratase/carnithine racemase